MSERTVNVELFCDFANRRLVSRDGSTFTLAPITEGDTLIFTLRPQERGEAGDLREKDLPIRTIRASWGCVKEAPAAGTFKLTSALGTTAAIQFDEAANQFSAKITPLFAVPPVEVTSPAPGCWTGKLTGGVLAEFEPAPDPEEGDASNRLEPVSFVRVRTWQRYGAEWWFEVRLIQAPLAWNIDGHERVLPDPPSVRRIAAGNAGSDVIPPSNELQALKLPPDFRGTYFIRWNNRKTAVLGIDDGPDELAAAFNAMFEGSTTTRFAVTNPEPDNAYIEFVGPLAGEPQPLATVEVNSFPPGVVTFDVPFDRAELFTALRAVPFLELPLEIEAELGDPETPEVPGRLVTLVQRATLRVEREEIYRELESVQSINWQRPPARRNYIPYTPEQIIVGTHSYSAAIGDGASLEISCPHNLGSSSGQIAVRQNIGGGRLLAAGVEYGVTFPSENELVLFFATAPAVASLVLTFTAAGPVETFLAHTHTMAQINGLLDRLAGQDARLENLEDLLPSASLAREDETSEPAEQELPELAELYPGRFTAGFDPSKVTATTPAASLPRPAPLLPAIHDATIDNLTSSLPAAAGNAGKVYQNNTTAAILLPGGGGRRTAYVLVSGYAGSDGRALYRVTKDGATNSYFPTDLERDLFVLHFNEKQWRAGGRIQIAFDLELQLMRANTRAQMVVVIEAGSAPKQTAPAPTGDNLENIVWAASPILAQRVVLSEVSVKHRFGAMVKRSLADALSAERLHYKTWTAAPVDSVPATTGIVFRARIIHFDTENNVSGAVGFIRYAFTGGKAEIV